MKIQQSQLVWTDQAFSSFAMFVVEVTSLYLSCMPAAPDALKTSHTLANESLLKQSNNKNKLFMAVPWQ